MKDKMNNKIRVLIVQPNKEAKQVRIEHSLKDLQNLVGGLIEYIALDRNTDVICNEEGKLMNLELNRVLGRDVIAGTFLVVGNHYGEIISLSKKQLKKYKKFFCIENSKSKIDFLEDLGIKSSDLVRHYYNAWG